MECLDDDGLKERSAGTPQAEASTETVYRSSVRLGHAGASV